MGVTAARFRVFTNAITAAWRGEERFACPIRLLTGYLRHAILKQDTPVAWRSLIRYYRDKYSQYRRDGYWDFNGAKMPFLDDADELLLFGLIFNESLFPLVYADNTFSEAMHEKYDRVFYGLTNDAIDVRVMPGDVVIDAGSWAGDFAAYAAACGASVWAFEPSPGTYEKLCRTAELNGRITPINAGLGDAPGEMPLYENSENTGNNSFSTSGGRGEIVSERKLPIVTIDSFAEEHGIERIDFIKSDIEGFERYMLAGARRVLHDHAPKLAISTYHLPDDPEVLERIIKEANPNYRVVHKPEILFAEAR